MQVIKRPAFTKFNRSQDELEHSLELHLPLLKRTFGTHPVTIVPIIVGELTPEQERKFGEALAPYLCRDDTLFVVSSDFCHWGRDFDYTEYENLKAEGKDLDADWTPIWEFI